MSNVEEMMSHFRSNYIFMQNKDEELDSNTKAFTAWKKGIPSWRITKNDIESITISRTKVSKNKVCLFTWSFEGIKKCLPVSDSDIEKIYGFILKDLIPYDSIASKRFIQISTSNGEEADK